MNVILSCDDYSGDCGKCGNQAQLNIQSIQNNQTFMIAIAGLQYRYFCLNILNINDIQVDGPSILSSKSFIKLNCEMQCDDDDAIY